jgi:hypothetical protein
VALNFNANTQPFPNTDVVKVMRIHHADFKNYGPYNMNCFLHAPLSTVQTL